MAVDLAGNVSNQAGTAKVGLTVELWEKSAYEGSGSRTGSTTTDSQGNWAFTGQDITKLWLVVVVDGTKKVLPVHSEGSQQLTKLDLITDMNVNTINEHTAAAGVTIDSVVLKDGGLTTTGAVTVGSDGSGADVIFYSGTAGDNLTWDASEELLTITGTDGNTALNVADGNVTIADNLTVSGNLTVTGTTTSVDSTTINAATAFVFEGATADAHETTLGIVDPTADATINLPAMSAGTYYLPVLAAASTTSVSSTPAELNLLDGSSANSVVNSKAVIYGSSGELAGTLSTAAQANVTSLGTLTALTVDDVAVDGKVITMTGSSGDTAVFTVGTNGTLSLVTTDTAAAAANIQITADGTVDIDSAGVLTLDSGAAINIEPAAGSAVLIDGNVSIDGDAVTGIATLAASGVITAGGFTIGSAAITEAELEILDGATVTTTELNLLDALDRGSILYGNASGVTTVLGQGTADQVLTSDGTDISWENVAGGASAASSAEVTTGSAVDIYVSPGRQHFHKSAAKAWVTDNTSSCSANASYGVSGVSSGATGIQTVTWTAAFPGGCTYAVAGTSFDPASVPHNGITCPGACTVIVHQRNTSHALADSVYGIVAYGCLAT
jgi:hypothetical protein